MASFAERLIAAHQAGLADRRSEQEQAFQKQLRDFQVAQLKHEQGRFKLLDQIDELKLAAEQNAAAKQQLELMSGQPGQVVPDTSPEGGTIVQPHAPVTFQGQQGSYQVTPPTLQELLQQRSLAERQAAMVKQQEAAAAPFTLAEGAQRVVPSTEGGAPTVFANPKAVQLKEPPSIIQELKVFYPNFDQLDEAGKRKALADYVNSKAQSKLLTPEEFAQQLQLASARAQAQAENRPLTEGERKAQAFYERATGAESLINQMAPEITQLNLGGQARLKFAPNVLQSETGQKYLQAAGDFINATLRRESGAAISQSEYDRFAKLYFPQPGDNAQTLQQKASARAILIGSIKTEAGRAFKETTTAVPTTTIKMKAPNGQVKEVSPDQVEHYKKLGATVVK